ncbi:MAG: AraC family transcriptional regulator [Bacteroidaceae bacterium]|nr:AraC family transcriptional regulator [Bacteroidaceae bacterium]
MKRIIHILLFIAISTMEFYGWSNVDLSYIATLPNDSLYEHAEELFTAKSDSAIFYYSILYNRYSESMNPKHRNMCAEAMLKTGIMHYKKNNYSEAMNIWLKGLKISQNNNFYDILSQIYIYIGNIYSVHNDYEQSVSFYKKSADVARQCNDIALYNHALNNLICALCYCEKTEDARKYFELLRANKEDNRIRYRYDLLISNAILLSCEKKNHEAIAYYQQAAQVANSENLGTQCIGAAYNGLAKIYVHTNELDSALKYFHLNESLARKTGTTDLLAVSLGNLAGIYERKKDSGNHQYYKTLYIELNDSIFNQREFNSLKNAQFLYELNSNNEIISQLTEQKHQDEQKISQQRLLILTISIGLLLGCMLLAYIWKQKRHLSSAYNELYNRNQEALKREESYKKRLLSLREIYETSNVESPPQPTVAAEKESVEDTKCNDSGMSISNELRMHILQGIIMVMANEEEICNNEFNIARLATLIGSNTRYVSQVINDEYGMNFRTLLNECRVKVAMKRISDNENYGLYTIKAISESVGYKSQANFIRVFTQYTGIKPSMYQKISKERV